MSSIRQTGAEFVQSSSLRPTDLIEIQRYNTANGYWTTLNIQARNLQIGQTQSVQISLPTITGLAGANVILFSAPFDGSVSYISAAVSGAFTSSNIVITPSIYNDGSGTAITGGVVTIPYTGSAVGTSADATPTAAKDFVAGDVITATVTGGSGSINGVISLLITRAS